MVALARCDLRLRRGCEKIPWLAMRRRGATMNGWPNISRARVIRYNLVFGSLCVAFAILVIVLSLAGVGGSGDPFPWITVVLFGALGLLAFLGVWAARRDQAREDAAAGGTE